MDRYDSNQKNYLLKSLKDIDLSKQMPLKISNTTINQIILKTNNVAKRVEEKCEIYCYIQHYFCTKTDQSLILINKDKNLIRKDPSNMQIEDSILRACLLKLFDHQKALFIIPKQACMNQYKKDLKLLKIPKAEESKYDDFIYYKIEIESILYNHPSEPPIAQYSNYIKKYQDEIRYLLINRHYSKAEKWANTIISKVFGMSNVNKAALSDKLKNEFLGLMKPIVLNKTLSLTLKEGKREKYEKAIKCIEDDYYKNYPNDYDESYLKITGRYAKYCIQIQDFIKAQNIVEKLRSKFGNSNTNCNMIINNIENEINQGSTKKKVINTEKKLFNILTNWRSENTDDYEWELSSRDVSDCLSNAIIDYGIVNALNSDH